MMKLLSFWLVEIDDMTRYRAIKILKRNLIEMIGGIHFTEIWSENSNASDSMRKNKLWDNYNLVLIIIIGISVTVLTVNNYCY